MQTSHGTLYYRTPAGEVIDLGMLGTGVTVSTTFGEIPTTPGQLGEEFINVVDQRQFIFTGLSWVERPESPNEALNIPDWTDKDNVGNIIKYPQGALVIHNGAIYRALQETVAVPGTDDTMWKHIALYMGVGDVLGIGRIDMFPVLPVPSSHLLCDGSKYDPKAYPELFAYLKTDTLPDLRNEFIRGWSATRNPLTKENWATGLPRTGFGTNTTGNHTHNIQNGKEDETGEGGLASGEGRNMRGSDTTLSTAGNHSHSITGGDPETRPANVALVYAIQATALVSMENPKLRGEMLALRREMDAVMAIISAAKLTP